MRGHKTLSADFFKVWTPDMAYVLGFFAADGNMIRNKRGSCYVAFYSSDLPILESIRSTLGSENGIGKKPLRNTNWKPQYHIQIGSKALFEQLLSLGFVPAKSNVLRFPTIPAKYLGDFVRGYFDGDGCVYFKKHFLPSRNREEYVFTTRFTSGSDQFLKSFLLALKQHGLRGGYLFKKQRGYELVFSRKDSVALHRLLYNNGHIGDLYLPRKRLLLETAINTLYPKLNVLC